MNSYKIKFIFTNNITNINTEYDILYSDVPLNNKNFRTLKSDTTFCDFIESISNDIKKYKKNDNITIAVVSIQNFIEDRIKRNKLNYKNVLVENVVLSHDEINNIATINTVNDMNNLIKKRYKFCT